MILLLFHFRALPHLVSPSRIHHRTFPIIIVPYPFHPIPLERKEEEEEEEVGWGRWVLLFLFIYLLRYDEGLHHHQPSRRWRKSVEVPRLVAVEGG